MTNIPNNQERWCDHFEEEEYIGRSPLPQVCAYQSARYVYNPDGSYANRSHTNSFHAGCSWAGWGYHDPLDGNYANGKRFSAKWQSDATSGWELIGQIRD